MTDLRSMTNGGDEVVVIAEAGVNHNGREDLAHELIDVAARSGADFVKFQTFEPDKLVAPHTEAARYQKERGAHSQSDLLRALALPTEVWPRLRDHAQKAGIGFLSTPFDVNSARMLVDLGVDALKVSSGELTNHPFLRDVSSLGVPVMVSTGMGSAAEVAAAVEACAQAPFLALFHCVSAYPAPDDEVNLLVIPTLSGQLGIPVGWSDHTVGFDSAIVAATLGARLFEKHFTLDRTMEGPDHAASLEPGQLAEYVSRLRAVPVMLGDGVKRRMPSEEENGPLVRRSWHAAADLPAGSVLTTADLALLRPESGISPTRDIVGMTLREPVKAGSAITAEALGADA